MKKRLFDLFFSVPGLILLSPVFVLVALLIKLDSPGPIIFRQERVGRFGRAFRIHKFRSMVHQLENHGSLITSDLDSRITKIGKFLRRYKLDELPQLVDVVKGDMSLVGPRPEVPKLIEHYPADIKTLVLSVRPGITDLASIAFKNESALLDNALNPEQEYIKTVLPKKLSYYKQYVAKQSLINDLWIIACTINSVFFVGKEGHKSNRQCL